MTKNKYSKLQIDINKVENWINIWCESNLDGTFFINVIEMKERIRYEIINDKKIILDFIKTSNGLFTISYKVGTQQNISQQLAEHIYQRIIDTTKHSPFNNGFSIIISNDEFDVVLSLLEEREDICLYEQREETRTGIAKYRLYRFRGAAGDSIVIKYYINTSRMQIQGKPLFVFNETVAYINEFVNKKDELVDATIKYCNLDITIAESYDELKSILGEELYNFLPHSHRALLSTAFNLRKVEFETEDYSYLLVNVCRAYEGFVKKIYAQKGLECEGEQQLGKFFEWENHTKPSLIEQYKHGLDEEIVKGFTDMFKFYSFNRHPYMHATGNDVTTTVISKRAIAIEKFDEMILSMISWYEWAKKII